jgi:hypothetical protein
MVLSRATDKIGPGSNGNIDGRNSPVNIGPEDILGNSFSTVEKNILSAKGLSAEHLEALAAVGVATRKDLQTVGDAATLRELVASIDAEVAERVMTWATGHAAAAAAAPANPVVSGKMLLDTSDVVYCTHCSAKQPKDYKSGDLCIACGRQAEPILSCFWCSASGPGKFCRACGARFVPTAELDLALLLRQEGLPKDEIPTRLESMSAAEKEQLWGRVRRRRG